MTAKEMFEKLGYELDSTHEIEGHLYFVKDYKKIDFDLNRKNFYKYNFISYYRCPISVEELKAINQQVKELHWND